MAFMEQEVVEDDWLEVETEVGGHCIPADLVGDPDENWDDETESYDPDYVADVLQYVEGKRVQEIRKRHGFGARLSAPGYLDCTEWTVFDTEQEALDYLVETYGDDEDDTE